MANIVTIWMVKIKKITIKLLLLTIFIYSFNFFIPVKIVNASGNTIYVDDSGGADYTSIQEAINSANETDTIYVYSGIYNENIVIDISLNLLGASSSSVTINGNSDHTIKVSSNNVQISDFTIKNTGESFSCIFLNSVTGCTISNNIIKNGGNGLYLISSNSNTILNNKLENNNIGLYLSNSDGNTIRSNTFQNNNANGIFLTSSSTDNTIYLNDFNDWEDNGYPNARDDGSNNWDYNSQGNYWDNYDGYDSEPDGIGDTPYSISGNGGNKDFFPLGDFLSLNQKPMAYIDSINPNPALQDQTISFNGHGSDDGNIIAWEWKSNSILLSSSEDFQKSDLSVGSYTISFRVQDNDEEWSNYVYKTLLVNTKSNTPPSAYISEPKESTYIYGKTVYFVGSGNDIDGDSITGYSWRSLPEYIISNDKSFSQSNIPVGTYIIYLKVRDSKGDWSQENSKTITIISDTTTTNNAPIANAGGPYIGTVNVTITLDGSGSYDPDADDELTFIWNFGDGITGEGVSPDHKFTSVGNYSVVLTLIDSHGESSTSTTNVEVKANGSSQNNKKDSNEIPGFEILFVIIAVAALFFIKKYRK